MLRDICYSELVLDTISEIVLLEIVRQLLDTVIRAKQVEIKFFIT